MLYCSSNSFSGISSKNMHIHHKIYHISDCEVIHNSILHCESTLCSALVGVENAVNSIFSLKSEFDTTISYAHECVVKSRARNTGVSEAAGGQRCTHGQPRNTSVLRRVAYHVYCRLQGCAARRAGAGRGRRVDAGAGTGMVLS